MAITNFTVHYDLLASDTDSSDQGVDADVIPLIGSVLFEPVTADDRAVLAPGYSPRPAGFKLRSFTGFIDVDGRLKAARSGAVGVRLWANDPVLDLEELTYKVTFNLTTPLGEPVRVDGGYFEAPSSDTTIQLADVLQPAGSPSSPLTKIAPGDVRLEDGEIVFSFAGVDIADPIPFEPSFAAAEISDSGAVGRELLQAETAAAARATIGAEVIGDVHNWRSDNTRKVHRSISKAIAGQASSHLIIGDSTSALYTGATTYAAMWPRLLGQYLNARGIPLAGTGWVSPANAENSLPKDSRFTFTGTWLQTGVPQGYLYSTTNGSSVTFTSDLPGTVVEVAYGAISGAFTVSIDGATPVTVTPPGVGSSTPSKYTVTGLLDTTHTVTVTLSTASLTQIFFFNVYKTAGLQIHNLALSGMTANAWVTEASGSRSQAVNRLGLTPDVVHIALGVNDLNYSATLGGTGSATATRIETIINSWPNADIILYGQLATSPSASVPTAPSNSTWSAYIDLLYGIADDRDVPLVDLYKRSGGSYSEASTNGLMGDSIHPNKTAQADWALLVTNLLTAKAA